MSWLNKLIVVNNLGCPKYKRNFAEFLVDLKKKLPSNYENMLGSFNIDQVVQLCYTKCSKNIFVLYFYFYFSNQMYSLPSI
jgi:hypothetical protein